MFLGEKTDSDVKIIKISNDGSFYGVMDDQNDP